MIRYGLLVLETHLPNCRKTRTPATISRIGIVFCTLTLGGCAFSLGSINTGLETRNTDNSRTVSNSIHKGSMNEAYVEPANFQAPTHPAILEAEQLMKSGQTNKALAVLTKAQKNDPQNTVLISALARTALKAGKIDLADKFIRKAGGFSSNDWRIISAKGVLLSRRGDYAGARQHFLRALEISPEQTSILSNLALTYILDNKPRSAAKILRRALKQEPGNQRLKQHLALAENVMAKTGTAKQPSKRNSVESLFFRRKSDIGESSTKTHKNHETDEPLILRPSHAI